MSEHQKQKKVSTSLKIKLLAVFLLIVYLIAGCQCADEYPHYHHGDPRDGG